MNIRLMVSLILCTISSARSATMMHPTMAQIAPGSSLNYPSPHQFNKMSSKNCGKEYTDQLCFSESAKLIATQARIALDAAEQMKEEFAQKYFKDKFEMLQVYFTDSLDNLPWTAKMPKTIGKSLPSEYFNKVSKEEILLNTHQLLRELIVWLSEIVSDEREDDYNFGKFKDLLNQASLVLHEVKDAIREQNLDEVDNVNNTNFIPQPKKAMTKTDAKRRSYIIYRDYINILEYIVQCFDHIRLTAAKEEEENDIDVDNRGAFSPGGRSFSQDQLTIFTKIKTCLGNYWYEFMIFGGTFFVLEMVNEFLGIYTK